MFKLWIDRNGEVQTFTLGSVEDQYDDLVKVLAHLKGRVKKLKAIDEESEKYETYRESRIHRKQNLDTKPIRHGAI